MSWWQQFLNWLNWRNIPRSKEEITKDLEQLGAKLEKTGFLERETE